MASKITILTVGITALLLGIVIFTFINYETLNANEGWGMVAIFLHVYIASQWLFC